MWSLIDMNKYSSMSLQYSRGCPFNCEFCDITFLDGNSPRTKGKEQILAEMDSLLAAGWPGEPNPDPQWLKPHLARLRSKLEETGAPVPESVRGVGYRLEDETRAR